MSSNRFISKDNYQDFKDSAIGNSKIGNLGMSAMSWLSTIRQGLTGLVDYLLPGVGRRIESDLAKINPNIRWKTQQDALNWVNSKLNQYSNDVEAKNKILSKLQEELNAVKTDVSIARNHLVDKPSKLREKLEDKVQKATKDVVTANNKLNNAYTAQAAAANSPDWSQNLAENFEKLANQIE
jgi:hypothetical protein